MTKEKSNPLNLKIMLMDVKSFNFSLVLWQNDNTLSRTRHSIKVKSGENFC